GPTATEKGASTAPGIERIDINPKGAGCTPVWYSPQRAPSAVPKLSLANGLVYAYTKPPRLDEIDAWYLTALSFRTGATVYEQLAGTGLGFNSNYAPISVGPDGPILGARVEHLGAKEALLSDDPRIYFTTSHFDGYPAILVRLDRIGVDELTEVVVEAWLARAPKRVREEYLRSNAPAKHES